MSDDAAVTTVRYHVVLGKRDELVSGPADADLVISVPVEDREGDPTVLYMQGRLKASGDTGKLFEVLASGQVARELQALRPS